MRQNKTARPRLESLEHRLAPAANFSFAYDHFDAQENWGSKSITVVRQGDAGAALSVDLAAVAGSAQPGQDYHHLQTTLTFAAGETSKSVSLSLIDDAVFEGTEALDVVLSNPTGGATLGPIASAVVNLADDDPMPGSGATFEFYYPTWTAQENWGYRTVTVVRKGDRSSAMSVDVATVAGSALPGQDYVHTQTTLTFAPGQASKDFNVHLVNDTVIEGAESLSVVLSNPVGDNAAVGVVGTATVAVTDDDASFSFVYDHFDTQENWGFRPITVVRQGFTGATMTVDLAAVAGSALPGQDYQPLSVKLTFAPGETSKTVNLSLVNDGVVEGAESLSVVLSGPTGGATLGAVATAVVNVKDDDVSAPGALQFSYATFTTNEGWGNVILYVTRSGGSTGAVSVDYAFTDGTAVNGGDYTAANGTLTFADGETTKTIVVGLTDDGSAEGMEWLSVALSNATGGATLGANAIATLNINDND